MKLIEIVGARDALQKLAAQDLPLRFAYKLMKFIDLANTHLGFYGREREKLGPNPDPERVKALNEMDIPELDVEKLRLPCKDWLTLSATDVKWLEPFIEFYEEEG